jgi:hypothetical protein
VNSFQQLLLYKDLKTKYLNLQKSLANEYKTKQNGGKNIQTETMIDSLGSSPESDEKPVEKKMKGGKSKHDKKKEDLFDSSSEDLEFSSDTSDDSFESFSSSESF